MPTEHSRSASPSSSAHQDVTQRTRRRCRLWIAGAWVLLTLFCIAYVDQPAATWSHQHLRRSATAVTMSRLSEPFVPLSVVILTLAGIAAMAGRRQVRNTHRSILLAALATLSASEIRTALKYVFGRTWPDTFVDGNPSWIQNHVYGFWPFHGGAGWSAFPSGHTAVITAALIVLWSRHPRFRLVYLAGLLVEVLGLYCADYHFVSDMLAGAMVGAVSAWAVMSIADIVEED